MINESQVLRVVGSVTDTPAYFYNGTLFLETTDGDIAVKVFNAIWSQISAALAFAKVGDETAYDFLA